MKKFVIIILILGCFGCQARYNLIINKDLTVKETIVGLESDSFFSRYTNSSKNRVISFAMATKQQYLDTNQFVIDFVEKNGLSGASAQKKYKNMQEYFEKSIAYSQYYEKWNYEDNNGIITLKTSNRLPGNQDSIERYYIDNGTKVSIKLPFKVIKHNADSYNNNTLTWKLNYNNKKNIYIKFDSNKYKGKYNQVINILAIIIISIIIVLSILLVLKKRLNNNKI